MKEEGSESLENIRLYEIPVVITGSYGTLQRKANSVVPLKGEYERMARRRFQNPKPERRGAWWNLLVWIDEIHEGQRTRKRKRIKLAPASTPVREVQKLAAEQLRPLNQGLESIGGASRFSAYVEETYKPVVLPLLAKPTVDRYVGVIQNYLQPAFGEMMLRDLTTATL